MRRWTSSDHHSAWDGRRVHVVLAGLLIVTAVCLGRQAPAAPVRRPPATSRLKVTQLPQPSTAGAVSVEQALLGLRNLPAPANHRLDLPKIGQLAWAMQGAMVTAGANAAGAVPLEIAAIKVYFALPDGVYLYNPVDHALQQADEEDVREPLAAALLNQSGAPVGGCQVIVAASLADFNKRYGTRGRAVMLLQAGRMAQSLQLAAVAQGLTFVSTDGADPAAVRRVVRSLRTLEAVYVAFVGYPVGQTPPATAQGQVSQAVALLVIPPQGFQDEEFLLTKRALEQGGMQVITASTRMGQLTGMLGGIVRADLLLNQANLDNFQALVFIGGTGAADYLHSPVVLNLVRQAVTRQKVLAAIGTAPSILANAGALKGARATAFLSEQARLVQGGAVYTGNPVERDGPAITATSAPAAALFARGILDAVAEKSPAATAPTK